MSPHFLRFLNEGRGGSRCGSLGTPRQFRIEYGGVRTTVEGGDWRKDILRKGVKC